MSHAEARDDRRDDHRGGARNRSRIRSTSGCATRSRSRGWEPSGSGSSRAGTTSSTSTRTRTLFTGETEPSTLNRTFGKNLLGSEGEYHDRIRSIIYPAFRADAIGHYPDEVIAPIANELIDAFAGARRGGARGRVRRAALRAGAEARARVSTWSRTTRFGAGSASWRRRLELRGTTRRSRRSPTRASARGRRDARADARRGSRATPDDTLLSSMLHSEVDGERLTRQEIQSNLKVMIVGGLQATSDLIAISHVGAALASRPAGRGDRPTTS